MTPEQFDVIATLIRSREPARSAARLVLLGGESKTAAGAKTNLTPQSVNNTVKRFQTAHELILAGYDPKRKK